ncbi:patatin-like phospholipase family protein [Lutimonas halocynthiae]|uniref:patatin-like phospholipase family protein n=1 Tax=Lutimonas halocynthiae TaxID=1446477 RepID=UPI0025B5C8D1|nr:patatin-like phospholipase family protein [Lutimonas halocynthiae]MDN3643837.1 patatin-like phospholipase family protein [Lutimonas halocynthiae]
MKALVISGGGSKGAFAGGIAQYLIEEKKQNYDLFVGTSTGSLMLTHLALGKLDELKDIYSNVDQKTIFSNCPFKIKKYKGHTIVGINHFNTVMSFLKGSRTFGESLHLREMINKTVKDSYLRKVKGQNKRILVTVSNLTLNQVEFKDLNEHSFDDFRDYIWASSNFVPFMSLLVKNNYEYADGGFANLVPIREAIRQGATEIDAIILETEVTQLNRMPSKNPFSLMMNLFNYMQIHIEKYNISIGKLAADNKDVKLNLYYTPTVLTTNTLVFEKEKMRKWWTDGLKYAREKEN